MPDFCTCGTELVPDSLFCHRCGKQQREIAAYAPEPETPVVDTIPPPAAPPRASSVDFHNPVAVRVAFPVALGATVLSMIPILGVFLWGAGGCFAAILYQRRTGEALNVKSGMRMGWITGVMVFALTTVISTVSLITATNSGGLSEIFRQQLKNPSDPKVQEALKLLETAPGMAMVLAVGLVMLFVLTTMLSMAGGALGAKWSSRSR